jgi:hypothetical protein
VLADHEAYLPGKILTRYELDDILGRTNVVTYRKATPPVIEYPTDDFMKDAFDRLKQPGDTLVVANRPKTHWYLIVLKERKEPQANNPEDMGKFNSLVIYPETKGKQLHVASAQTTMPLSDFVLRERAIEFAQKWREYMRERTHFNTTEADRLAQLLQTRN